MVVGSRNALSGGLCVVADTTSANRCRARLCRIWRSVCGSVAGLVVDRRRHPTRPVGSFWLRRMPRWVSHCSIRSARLKNRGRTNLLTLLLSTLPLRTGLGISIGSLCRECDAVVGPPAECPAQEGAFVDYSVGRISPVRVNASRNASYGTKPSIQATNTSTTNALCWESRTSLSFQRLI